MSKTRSESAVNETAQHTPKPWLIEESRSEVDSKCIVARGSNVAVVMFRTHEEQANANLIAAAPDMLEALKGSQHLARQFWAKARDGQGSRSANTAIIWRREAERLEIVIAKAEGSK